MDEPALPDTCAPLYSESEAHALRAATLTSAGLSLFGSGFIIFSYWEFLRSRTFPNRLVLYLSVANLFSSVAYYVGLGEDDDVCDSSAACMIAAAMTQFFDVASFLWILVIAYNVWQVLVKGAGRSVEALERRYHLTAWGLSLVLVLVVAATKSFGDSGLWCWIKQDKQAVRFTCYYLPLLLVFTLTSVLYFFVCRHLQGSSHRATVTNRLRLYLLVFVGTRIWSIAHRTQNYLSDEPVFSLALAHAIFSPLQGFANALVYGLNRSTVREYRNLCRRSRGRGAAAGAGAGVLDEFGDDDLGDSLDPTYDESSPGGESVGEVADVGDSGAGVELRPMTLT